MSEAIENYPSHWEADVVLSDGRPCHLRPIRPDDGELLVEFHSKLSEETIYFRFFAPYPTLSRKDVERFTQVDYRTRVALVATMGEEMIGVGRFDAINATEAEVAFTILDSHQGRGLGSVLLEHLTAIGRELRFRKFTAQVLPTNVRMVATFVEAGYEPAREMEDNVVLLTFNIAPNSRSREVTASREHRSDARSVKRIVTPRSIAVIGASRRHFNLGRAILHNLQAADFQGDLYVIHPEEGDLDGVASFRQLRDIGAPVDVVVITTQVHSVETVIADCAAAGVSSLVDFSRGYSEIPGEGWRHQSRLVSAARGSGIRVVGPYCFGVINTDPEVKLNATILEQLPRSGSLGLFCQSGALGLQMLDRLKRRNMGLATFVSVGNRADISGNDFMQYWEQDEQTSVVLMYLESIGNPRKFTRVARRLARKKPVVVLRSGRFTQAIPLGQHVRSSTLPSYAVDAMFRQSGVIQTETIDQMFDIGQVMLSQPLPKGRRVRLVGNTESMAAVAFDACQGANLQVVNDDLLLDGDATTAEMIADMQAADADEDTDTILFLYAPLLLVSEDEPLEVASLLAAAAQIEKPIITVLITTDRDELRLPDPDRPGRSVPVFNAVEDAVRALKTVTNYAQWADQPMGKMVELSGIDEDAARSFIAHRLPVAGQTYPLSNEELQEFLSFYGIAWTPPMICEDAQTAVEQAKHIGYPVIVKSIDWTPAAVGGGFARLNLYSAAEVTAAFDALTELTQTPLCVQEQVPTGISVVIESREDPHFGPAVSFGVSGPVPEVLSDRAYRIPPLTDRNVRALVRDPAAAPLLFGYGDTEAADVGALEELIHRIGALSDAHPEVLRLKFEPVIVSPQGVWVVDVLGELARPQARTDSVQRKLR